MPSPPAPVPVGRVATLLGLLVALTVIGSSAVAVALPDLRAELGIATGASAWVLAAFSLTFSISTAVFGRVADLHGLRLPLRIGVVLFAVGALLAAVAPSFGLLLAGRLVQGAGAGAVPVLASGIIAARFEGARRSAAFAGVTAVVSVVSGSGPLIGGALTAVAGWRAVLALPAVALLLVEPVARLAPTEAAGRGRLDVRGAALVAVAISGLVLLLQAPATGLPGAVVGAVAVIGGAAAVALVRHTRGVPDGFLPPAVTGNRALVLSALSGLTLLAGYLATLFALPQLLAAERGWTPLQIGLALLPAAATGAIASRVVGARVGHAHRYRLAAGLGLGSTVGLLLVAVGGAGRPAVAVLGFAMVVIGFAGGQVVLVDGVAQLVDPSVRGVALGVFNLLFFTGGAIGTALTGGLTDVLGLPGALAVLAVLPVAGAAAALGADRAAARAPGVVPAR